MRCFRFGLYLIILQAIMIFFNPFSIKGLGSFFPSIVGIILVIIGIFKIIKRANKNKNEYEAITNHSLHHIDDEEEK